MTAVARGWPRGSKVRSAGDCSRAAKELAERHTSKAGKRLAACVGGSCSVAGWRLRVLGTSQAGRRLRKCGLGRRSNPPTRRLPEVAADIRRHWPQPYYAVVPYIEAMDNLQSLSGRYGGDDGTAVVINFLAHSGMWSGREAHRIKTELRDMVGIQPPSSPATGPCACPMCGGQPGELGALGAMLIMRCVSCGHDWGCMVPGGAPTKARKAPPKAPPKAAARKPRRKAAT